MKTSNLVHKIDNEQASPSPVEDKTITGLLKSMTSFPNLQKTFKLPPKIEVSPAGSPQGFYRGKSAERNRRVSNLSRRSDFLSKSNSNNSI